MIPTIAIIGRPNVGKSTLFNRLAGRPLALVDRMPGLTRDRREVEATIGERDIRLFDTAGLEEGEEGSLPARMRAQSEAAIAEADIILFIIDARAGVVPSDEVFADLVRRAGKPVIVIANKCEGRAGESGFYEAYRLGLGEPIALSAEHNEGLGELYRAMDEACEALADEEGDAAGKDGEHPLRIAIVGRPNAGKSTLVNALLGEERMITGPEAGITRDSIPSDLVWKERRLRLFDTAGLRRKSRISEFAEKLSVGDALRAIQFAEVVVLTIDAMAPFEKQDLQIADLVASEGRALVIAVNKWDLVEDKAGMQRFLEEEVARLLPQVAGVALMPVSALKKQGLGRLMSAVLRADEIWNQRVPTAALNRWLEAAIDHHSPPAVSGRRIRLRFMTQPNARPPTFVAFCSRPEKLPESYKRYLVNGLREAFDMPGVPIRLNLKKGKNPYVR